MVARLSKQARAKIVYYKYTLGLNVSDIARKLRSEGIKVSRTSTGLFLKRYKQTNSLKDADRKPRDSVLHENEINSINEWITNNKEITAKTIKNKILDLYNVNPSLTTVRNAIKKLGWQKFKNEYCKINQQNKDNTSKQQVKEKTSQFVDFVDIKEKTTDTLIDFLETQQDITSCNVNFDDLNELEILNDISTNMINNQTTTTTTHNVNVLNETPIRSDNTSTIGNSDVNTTTEQQNNISDNEILNETNIVSKSSFLKLRQDEIIYMFNNSISDKHFALNLCRRLFTKEELKGCNVYGRCSNNSVNKRALDSNRIDYIKEICLKHCTYTDSKAFWSQCVEAINKGILKYSKVPLNVNKRSINL